MNIRVERWNEDGAPEADDITQRLQAEGYDVFQWTDPPSTSYGPHAHPEDQSHWVLSGELIMRVGDETYTLRAGDRDFLPANTTHSAFVSGFQPVVYLIGTRQSRPASESGIDFRKL